MSRIFCLSDDDSQRVDGNWWISGWRDLSGAQRDRRPCRRQKHTQILPAHGHVQNSPLSARVVETGLTDSHAPFPDGGTGEPRIPLLPTCYPISEDHFSIVVCTSLTCLPPTRRRAPMSRPR
jgi:hypothetical protein